MSSGTSAAVDRLVKRAVSTAATVASWLELCEAELAGGILAGRESRFDPALMTPTNLVSRFRQAQLFDPLGLSSPNENADTAERLARLILSAWVDTVRPGLARRPDVLDLTCQFLANPDAPHTLRISQFATTLALRGLYGVRYHAESLKQLRDAYDSLHARFLYHQRRRVTKSSTEYDNLLLDALCMHRWVFRSLTPTENAVAYYGAFRHFPFGVTEDRRRRFAEASAGDLRWPELSGDLPDFGSVVNLLFSQPTALRGFDEVTGGLVPTISSPDAEWKGGLVTLIAGPPGSGKTTLCSTIASGMAQLGSTVRYVTTEEEAQGIEAKRITAASSIAAAFEGPMEDATGSAMRVVDARDLQSFKELRDVLDTEFHLVSPSSPGDSRPHVVRLYLAFPRVVVIDSLTALVQSAESRSSEDRQSQPLRRRELAQILNRLRDLGLCVFLVGGAEDAEDEGLAYLVDNIFILSAEPDTSGNHFTRILTVRKTRFQTSHRGRHVFHLSRRDGCSVSPSIHALLASLRGRELYRPDPNTVMLLWTFQPVAGHQLDIPGLGQDQEPISLRSHSQILIYGRGSAGKARLGLALALEPRVHKDEDEEWKKYAALHADAQRALTSTEAAWLVRSRVLVLSFLYERRYYEDLVVEILRHRFRLNKRRAQGDLQNHLRTLAFYPGFIDAETVLALVREELDRGKLEGRPYTSVLIDGVHNILVQFPIVERQPLLWPALSRLLRTAGVDVVTTFTFFQIARLNRGTLEPRGTRVPSGNDAGIEAFELEPSSSQQLFFHLLVGSSDYSLLAERPSIAPDRPSERNWIRVRLASTIDGYGRHPDEFWWDPSRFRYAITHRRKGTEAD